MLKKLLPVCLAVAAFLASVTAYGAELVIAENDKSDYQIVIPDKSPDEIVDTWLFATAKLTQAAFEKNGFTIEVIKESAKAADKSGIYLGATEFAKKNGVNLAQYDDWTYVQKAVGKDIIICGNDKKDPTETIRSTDTPLALLGTVKGTCDFLREYVGVRFLFLNMDQTQYVVVNEDGLPAYNEDGSLNVDTRSIAFTPVQKIAVAEDLDLQKTPMMRANYDAAYETFYYIANNFFPMLSFTQGSSVVWYNVISPEKYAETHPEYFALLSDGKRACETKVPDYRMRYCVTNQGVQDLMYEAAEKLIENGEKTIGMSVSDAYRLCQCNCDDCNKLFGGKGGTWDEYRARGDSGKLWQVFFNITERIRENYPDVKVVIVNYQDTPVNENVIKTFPPNIIVKIQFASQNDFDRLKGVEFPSGICGFEETFTGFGQAGPYVPERTPEHMAEVVQAMARNNVKWSMRDGLLGYVRGLQAPAYYVYGRMMDDPSADWEAIYDEFCKAAFGEVEPQMRRFFGLLDMQMAIYSDFYGVMMPGWNRKYSRSAYHNSKWHVMQMYTPEYCADAEELLASAEKATEDPDVKARLHLIRIEFDYITKMSRIFYLEDAWLLNRTDENLNVLLDAIDDWHAYLKGLVDPGDRSPFNPLSDWPEMRPFSAHFYRHAALERSGYQQQWSNTCLNWDTEAIRGGATPGSSRRGRR